MNDNINNLAFVEACCKSKNYKLVEFRPPLYDCYMKQKAPSYYRVVRPDNAEIVTSGTLENIKAFFTIRCNI